MLAGHTHGGQLSLDFVTEASTSAISYMTTTVDGMQRTARSCTWNRGIGTTGFPIRLGARPEISVFELSRT